jgi:hypothetical protein
MLKEMKEDPFKDLFPEQNEQEQPHSPKENNPFL